MELEITWKRAVRVWWAYTWRNLLATLVSMLIGYAFGFLVGMLMGAVGFSTTAIQVVTAPLGFLLGLAISVVPMKMILGMNFGEFRLVLASKEADRSPPPVV